MFLHSCLIPTHRRLIPLNFSISKKKTVAKKRTQMSPLVRTESRDLQKAESVENYHKKYIFKMVKNGFGNRREWFGLHCFLNKNNSWQNMQGWITLESSHKLYMTWLDIKLLIQESLRAWVSNFYFMNFCQHSFLWSDDLLCQW